MRVMGRGIVVSDWVVVFSGGGVRRERWDIVFFSDSLLLMILNLMENRRYG